MVRPNSAITVGSHVYGPGPDTMFVAPVTIGDGAYNGAGTVVWRMRLPGALAVSAGPQRNIENWVQRKRPGSPAAQASKSSSEMACQQPTQPPDADQTP